MAETARAIPEQEGSRAIKHRESYPLLSSIELRLGLISPSVNTDRLVTPLEWGIARAAEIKKRVDDPGTNEFVREWLRDNAAQVRKLTDDLLAAWLGATMYRRNGFGLLQLVREQRNVTLMPGESQDCADVHSSPAGIFDQLRFYTAHGKPRLIVSHAYAAEGRGQEWMITPPYYGREQSTQVLISRKVPGESWCLGSHACAWITMRKDRHDLIDWPELERSILRAGRLG